MKLWTLLAFLISISCGGFASAQNFCRQAHVVSKSDSIAQSNLNEYVVPTKDGFLGFYLDGGVFRSRAFSTWQATQSFYDSLSRPERNVFSARILASKVALPDQVARLTKLAQVENAEFKYGIKDLASLKNKILDRIQSAEKEGREFRLDELHDISRARLAVPFSSRLLRLTTVQEWARALDLPESSIIDVDVKGRQSSLQHKKYYTATHIAIRGRGGQYFELQVMSKAMAIWHGWDHQNVYKPSASPEGAKRLRLYSSIWSQIIQQLTTSLSFDERTAKLQEIAQQHGVTARAAMTDLVLDLDQAVKMESDLSRELGFSREDLARLAHAFQESAP